MPCHSHCSVEIRCRMLVDNGETRDTVAAAISDTRRRFELLCLQATAGA